MLDGAVVAQEMYRKQRDGIVGNRIRQVKNLLPVCFLFLQRLFQNVLQFLNLAFEDRGQLAHLVELCEWEILDPQFARDGGGQIVDRAQGGLDRLDLAFIIAALEHFPRILVEHVGEGFWAFNGKFVKRDRVQVFDDVIDPPRHTSEAVRE